MSELERVKREGEVARVKAEAEAKAEAERRLEEMQLKRIHVKAEEDRRRALEIIHLVSLRGHRLPSEKGHIEQPA